MSPQWALAETVYKSKTHNLEHWLVVVFLLLQVFRRRDERLPEAVLEKLQLNVYFVEQPPTLPALKIHFSNYLSKHHNHKWLHEAQKQLMWKDLRSRGKGEADILYRFVMGLGQHFWGHVYVGFAPSKYKTIQYSVTHPRAQVLYQSSVHTRIYIHPATPRGLFEHSLAIVNLHPDVNKPGDEITTRELFLLMTMATTTMRTCEDMRRLCFMSRVVSVRGTWVRLLTANLHRDLLHSMLFRLKDLYGQGEVSVGTWVNLEGGNGREEVLAGIFQGIPGYTVLATVGNQAEHTGSGGEMEKDQDHKAKENMARRGQRGGRYRQDGDGQGAEEEKAVEKDHTEVEPVLKGGQRWCPAVEDAVDELEFEVDEVAVRNRRAHLARSRRFT